MRVSPLGQDEPIEEALMPALGGMLDQLEWWITATKIARDAE